MKKMIAIAVMMCMVMTLFAGCAGVDYELSPDQKARQEVERTKKIAGNLLEAQPTPTDITYSLERYNLIRRSYWVNGQREKANTLPCEVEKPLGYVVLFSGSAIIGNFIVDGKISSLNSYLSPDSEYYSSSNSVKWLSDVDGSYGENDSGIFFFTPDGKYVEWTGTYLYSDIPFMVDSPVVKIGG